MKLVFVKAYLEHPTFNDTFSQDVEIDSPGDIKQFRLIGARIFEGEEYKNIDFNGDINSSILEYHDESDLIGKLLTYVDATFTDQEQRKAHKDIVRQIVQNWRQDISLRGVQTVDSQLREKPYVSQINK